MYVATQRGLNESNIRKWVGFYPKYGKAGLLPRENQSYSIGFKMNVLKAIAGKSFLYGRLVLHLMCQQYQSL